MVRAEPEEDGNRVKWKQRGKMEEEKKTIPKGKRKLKKIYNHMINKTAGK